MTKPLLAHALMILLGVISAGIAIAPVLGFEYLTMDYQLIRPQFLTLFFVIPIITPLIGFVGCLGYYFGARITHYRPGKYLLINMLIFAVLIHPCILILEYQFIFNAMHPDPKSVSFAEFVYRDIFESNYELRTKSGRGGRSFSSTLLSFGVTLVVVGGYISGALAVYAWIREIPSCPRCGKFVKIRGKQVRYPLTATDVGNLDMLAQELGRDMDREKLDLFLKSHALFRSKRNWKHSTWRTILRHEECPGCGADFVEFQCYSLSGKAMWQRTRHHALIYLPRPFGEWPEFSDLELREIMTEEEISEMKESNR